MTRPEGTGDQSPVHQANRDGLTRRGWYGGRAERFARGPTAADHPPEGMYLPSWCRRFTCNG
jgi:hypothetical protein